MIITLTQVWRELPIGTDIDGLDDNTAFDLIRNNIATLKDINSNKGVCNGCIPAGLSDTVDLAHPGYIRPTFLAGNIKVTDVYGNISTLAFDLKEVSLFRVKRVWSTGTTANMGIVVIY